jgi:hypothetical protein
MQASLGAGTERGDRRCKHLRYGVWAVRARRSVTPRHVDHRVFDYAASAARAMLSAPDGKRCLWLKKDRETAAIPSFETTLPAEGLGSP